MSKENPTNIQVSANLSFCYSFGLSKIEQDWSKACGHNTYLSVSYLKALQESAISYAEHLYVVCYQDQQPIGVAYFQRIEVKDTFFSQKKFPHKINARMRSLILKKMKGNLLLCGNFFATGVNGFYFKETKLSELLPKVVDKLIAHLQQNNQKVNFVMYKEFWMDKNTSFQKFLNKKHERFQIDVNMILSINPSWTSFEDYLNSMTTKYRTRAKVIYKKNNHIVCRDFSALEILQYQLEINELFASVLKTSSFNMVQPNVRSFYELKLALKEAFVFRGYFEQDTMVAFSIACKNLNYIDASYVGIDYSVNNKTPIYQRLLYDYVVLAIENRVEELRLGRTAEIMKSSLGALPVPMNLYAKHTNPWLHAILKPLLVYVQPSTFEIRSPFKN